jgi:SAM-dependent methyltransferase
MDAMLAATADAEERHFWFKGLRRTARQMLDAELTSRRVSQIVDCGSGTGRNLDWLADYGPVAGVELSATGLAVARRHHRPVVQGSVTHLPFADSSVDLATSFDVLYCLPDDEERMALREMFRVLRPGGLALFNVAALDMLHGSHSALTMEVRRYTRARLRTRLEAAGFQIARMTFTNFTTFPLTLAVRWSDRIRGQAETASTSDLRVPAAPINVGLDVALRLEAQMMRVVDLPIGSSLLCLARRGGE